MYYRVQVFAYLSNKIQTNPFNLILTYVNIDIDKINKFWYK